MNCHTGVDILLTILQTFPAPDRKVARRVWGVNGARCRPCWKDVLGPDGAPMSGREISLRDEAWREWSENEETTSVHLADLRRPSCEEAFISHYDEIRERCAALAGRDGLAIVAIDGAGVAASAFLPRQQDSMEVAVVGRHRLADLWLGAASIALRHLLILAHAGQGAERTRYRVLDLRTDAGMMDERGEALRSFEADGPVFFQVDRTSFLTLPTAVPFSWPDDPLAAWNAFPARSYDGTPFSHRRRSRTDDYRELRTNVGIGSEVVDVTRALTSGSPVGSFEIQNERGRLSLLVDRAALHAGVLIGRYERCDSGGLDHLALDGCSRVHALLLEVDGRVHVVDTASTHGVHVGGSAVRVHAISAGEEVVLGQDVASLRWHATH